MRYPRRRVSLFIFLWLVAQPSSPQETTTDANRSSLGSIDLDLPIGCDDEYWLNPNPELAFKQPEGKPSTVTFFNCALRLTQIHAFALRTIVRGFSTYYDFISWAVGSTRSTSRKPHWVSQARNGSSASSRSWTQH